MAVYNQILKLKPNDIALTAVISNNIVAAHKVFNTNAQSFLIEGICFSNF